MDAKIPTVLLCVLGVLIVIFNKQTCRLIQWLDKKIWNEERRKEFPGHGGKVNPTPKGVIILGLSWIISAVVIWFTLK
jgi:hypothetical protein